MTECPLCGAPQGERCPRGWNPCHVTVVDTGFNEQDQWHNTPKRACPDCSGLGGCAYGMDCKK